MAYKTQPKRKRTPTGGQKRYARPQMILKSDNVKVTGKKAILYSDVIRKEILKSDILVDAIVEEINKNNLIEDVFDKAGYVPIVSAEKITKKSPGPKRNFKNDEDRQKAVEHIIERYKDKLEDVNAEAGFLQNAKGKKRQNRKKLKGVPLVKWDVGIADNAGRKSVVIFSDDYGVGFQEAELGKIGPKMRRKSKRTKKPEDGI